MTRMKKRAIRQRIVLFCLRLLRHQRNHLEYIGPRMPPANAGMMNVYVISQKSMAICFYSLSEV